MNGAQKLAVFWGLRARDRTRRPAGLFVPAGEAPFIGGFRTIEAGHVDLWPKLVARCPKLRGREYDEVPRGRVNWRQEDDRYLVLLDRTLMTESFTAMLRARLCLPQRQVILMGDPHYRCRP